MAEMICQVTIKPVGSDKVKIQGNFPLHATNVGECTQLAQVLNSNEIQNLMVKRHANVRPEVITCAIVKDDTINGKRIKPQICYGIFILRKFILRNGGSRVSLIMQWGDSSEVADAEADLNRLMPRPYQST